MLKLIGIALLTVIVALGAGWVWGASGRSEIEQARDRAVVQAEFAQARAHLLEARVSLFLVNFGEAGRHLDEARAVVSRLQIQLRERGEAERAGQLEIVLAHIGDAGRQALAVDQAAQNSAAEALRVLAATQSAN